MFVLYDLRVLERDRKAERVEPDRADVGRVAHEARVHLRLEAAAYWLVERERDGEDNGQRGEHADEQPPATFRCLWKEAHPRYRRRIRATHASAICAARCGYAYVGVPSSVRRA